jgi:NADH-quinone oxidoreductase subunit F
MEQILERIVRGRGLAGDKELLLEICTQIDGRSFCGLGDAAAWPVAGAIKVFPEEFDYFIEHGRSMVSSPLMASINPSWIASGAPADATR